MDYTILSYAVTIIQILVLIALIIFGVRKLKEKGSQPILGFCLYAFICILLMDLYWLTSIVLKPELRIPYSVGDIADSGTFLLFASGLGIAFRGILPREGRAGNGQADKEAEEYLGIGIETVLTILFSVAVTALWISWKDEWVKNIIGGIPFGYLMWQTVMAVKKSHALSKKEAVTGGMTAYVLVIMMGIAVLTGGKTGESLDYVAGCISSFVMLLLAIKSVLTHIMLVKGMKDLAYKALALDFLTIVWALNTSYICEEPLYSMADLTYTCMLPLMMSSLFAVSSKKGIRK